MIRTVLLSILLATFMMTDAVFASEQPNILVILADDMGYGDISCYGSKQIHTPNIDALADRGVKCNQAYVAMMVCAPSRAGIMTGRYPNRFGFEHNIMGGNHKYRSDMIGLSLEESTIADRLKEAGYQTACIGKWHLGGTEPYHPNSRGFDYYFGRFKGHGYFPKVKDKSIYRQRKPVESIDFPYMTDWCTEETIQYIEKVDPGTPWFIYLAYDTPHTPLQAKEEDIAKFSHIKNRGRRIYCAMQHCMDQNIGRIIESLDKLGQLDNTLIVFLSDNGGTTGASINAPLRGAKGTFLEGGLRVPMIYSWPNKFPQGVEYDPMVISLDLLPTFVAAAGSKLPAKPEVDGVNLIPYLEEAGRSRSSAGVPHDELYFRMTLRGAAYRDGDWKLVRVPYSSPELYNLADDISERNNLANEYPERVKRMLTKLNEWEGDLQETPRWLGTNNWIDHNRKLYSKDYILTQPEDPRKE